MQCGNANCIVCDPAERQYAANKFYVVDEQAAATLQAALRVLRDRHRRGQAAAQFVVADTTRRTFTPGLEALAALRRREKLKHLVIHRSEADAMAAGFRAAQEAG